jgi:outer membrane protein OmpA-like peptidoglycan-associated protein
VREFLIESGLPEDKVIVLDDPEALDTPERSVRIRIAGAEPFQQIYFNAGSISLNERDQAKLDFMLDYIERQQPKAKLLLKGHTDSSGSRQGNLIVSKRRLNVIKKYLVSKGIDASRVITKAYGESRPATTNRYPGGRQLNRRVEISIKS